MAVLGCGWLGTAAGPDTAGAPGTRVVGTTTTPAQLPVLAAAGVRAAPAAAGRPISARPMTASCYGLAAGTPTRWC
ncbi:MAG: hypothetical protein WKG07_04890 [Hymenobacter sp.]